MRSLVKFIKVSKMIRQKFSKVLTDNLAFDCRGEKTSEKIKFKDYPTSHEVFNSLGDGMAEVNVHVSVEKKYTLHHLVGFGRSSIVFQASQV